MHQRGTRHPYEVSPGAPLILVSGATADRRADTQLADALAETFTVYNYDRRGRGDSTDTRPFAVEREIEDIGGFPPDRSHLASTLLIVFGS